MLFDKLFVDGAGGGGKSGPVEVGGRVGIPGSAGGAGGRLLSVELEPVFKVGTAGGGTAMPKLHLQEEKFIPSKCLNRGVLSI